MNKIIEGMTEALAVAKGDQPAARITIHGHTYVPLSVAQALRAALAEAVDDIETYAADEMGGLRAGLDRRVCEWKKMLSASPL